MLQELQRWIESTYQLEAEVPASEFLIDKKLLLQNLDSDSPFREAEEVLLIAKRGEEYQLGLYLDPQLLAQWERNPSQPRPHPLLTALEGVSHLRLVLHRLRSEIRWTRMEMELQAEVDKFLFLRMRGSGADPETAKLHLQSPADLPGLGEAERETYETARRLAYRYCMRLERDYLSPASYDGLFQELRQFYRRSHWQKLQDLGPP